jgi:hypothetical protein
MNWLIAAHNAEDPSAKEGQAFSVDALCQRVQAGLTKPLLSRNDTSSSC